MKRLYFIVSVLMLIILCSCNRTDYENSLEDDIKTDVDCSMNITSEQSNTNLMQPLENIETTSSEKETIISTNSFYDSAVELNEFLICYQENNDNTDYANEYNLKFDTEEQKEVYNKACAFVKASPQIDADTQYGKYNIQGSERFGWLTGYSFKSFDAYRRTIFTAQGIYNRKAYEYIETGELFWLDADKGGFPYYGEREIIYSDDKSVIIRLHAFNELDNSDAGYYFTILVFTEEGWRVNQIQQPNI